MSGPRCTRAAILAALMAVAAISLWQLTATEHPEDRDPLDDTDRPLTRPLKAAPLLEAAGRAPLVNTARPPEAATAVAEAEDRQPAAAGAVLPGAVLGPLFPLAPGAVVDRVAPEARQPIVLPRSHVVGRVGPYGVRAAAASAGFLDWNGVARIERETRAPSEAKDDTEEPITTALHGVVVAEDGAPVAGAEVILFSSFYLRQAYYDHRVRQIGRVLTDADGVFDVRPLDLDTVHFGADGHVLVTVRHARYPDLVAQALPGVVPGQVSDVGKLLLPTRSARVFGVVKDLQGKPVQGAAVRASGAMNPVDYDKTERMVVLGTCPTAITDAEGRYDLGDFAGGRHEISIHVNIDCVLHMPGRWTGEREWSPRVRAGNGIRGRVVDPNGDPVAAAVVAGGGNWTPTNADGTFWLDNIQPGPLTLEVAHHLWHTVFVPGVEMNADDEAIDLELALAKRLALVTLEVVDEAEAPIPLVAIDWRWPQGRGPGRFAPDSRFWHDAGGVFELIVPEGAVGAQVSRPNGSVKHQLEAATLIDGARLQVALP